MKDYGITAPADGMPIDLGVMQHPAPYASITGWGALGVPIAEPFASVA